MSWIDKLRNSLKEIGVAVSEDDSAAELANAASAFAKKNGAASNSESSAESDTEETADNDADAADSKETENADKSQKTQEANTNASDATVIKALEGRIIVLEKTIANLTNDLTTVKAETFKNFDAIASSIVAIASLKTPKVSSTTTTVDTSLGKALEKGTPDAEDDSEGTIVTTSMDAIIKNAGKGINAFGK